MIDEISQLFKMEKNLCYKINQVLKKEFYQGKTLANDPKLYELPKEYERAFKAVQSKLKIKNLDSVNFVPNLINEIKNNRVCNSYLVSIMTALFSIKMMKAELSDYLENRTKSLYSRKHMSKVIRDFCQNWIFY
jgi:hypothetical protein